MQQYGITKRRKNVSVVKLRLTLVAFLAMHFPNLICNITSQLSSISDQKVNYQYQTFQNLNFSDITLVDKIAQRLMQKLHDELDYDDDGNVSLDEGAEFIDREDFESDSSNLPGFATDKDGRITEVEFWDSWKNSSVHNWTVSQMTEWLSFDVDLPQYGEKFRFYGISGAAMPILAGNNSVVLSLVGGVKEHRLKLWLKAMEVVLCGYSQPKTHFLKDVLLSISVLFAFGGITYALHVRRNAAAAVALMKEKLDHLQKEMKVLEEEEQWLRESCADETGDDPFNQNDANSSHSSLESESSSLYCRLLDELCDTRQLLEQAEVKLHDRKWKVPDRLIMCLRETHKVEMKLHECKRQLAHKKVDQAKTQFLKMKKKTSFFNHIQLLHSRQVDNFDVEIELAKEFLREVQRDSHEYKKRWREIECICQISFSLNHVTSVKIQNHSNLSKFTRKPSDAISTSSGCSVSVIDYSEDSESGLIMKDISSAVETNSSHVTKPTQGSQISRGHRRSEPTLRSSALLGVSSSNHKSPSPIPEEGSGSSQNVSRRSKRNISPLKFSRISPRNWGKYDSTDGASTHSNDVKLTSTRALSKSTRSLPDLTSSISTASAQQPTTKSSRKKFGTFDKKFKKRGMLGTSFLKKIIKS